MPDVNVAGIATVAGLAGTTIFAHLVHTTCQSKKF